MQENENFTRDFHSLTPSQSVQVPYEKLEKEVTINHNILSVNTFCVYIFGTVHRTIHM